MPFTAQGVVPGKTYSVHLQNIQVQAISKTNSYQQNGFTLFRDQSRTEVAKRELDLQNGKLVKR